MIGLILVAALSAAAVDDPPHTMLQAKEVFGACVHRHARVQHPLDSPEQAADRALSACRPERASLDRQFARWVDDPAFGAANRSAARADYRSGLARLPAQLSHAIFLSRGYLSPDNNGMHPLGG